MSDVVSFQEAIDATKGEDRALLVGNGFSIDYFNYKTLLEKARLGSGLVLVSKPEHDGCGQCDG